MPRNLRVRHLPLAAAMSAALVSTSAAQGGWPQWDLRLRDGTHVEANPLGALHDSALTVSVGGMEGHDRTIPRARVDLVAARPAAGAMLPPPPAPACDDVVVRRDGTRTIGRVTFAHVVYSAGTLTQHGHAIDLGDVAYIRLAHAPRATCDHHAPKARRRSSRDE